MITDIKRKDVSKLIGNEIGGTQLYYVLDQAADKIRAIYQMFGWVHMTKDMHQADDLILELLSGCAESLVNHPKQKDSRHSSAGVSVDLYEDEEGLMNIEVSFNIIN